MSSQLMNKTAEKYEMIFEGIEDKWILKVSPEDLIENADGELDCPLEYVLRRNDYSLKDLNELSPIRAIFVQKKNGNSIVLNEISLNVNF